MWREGIGSCRMRKTFLFLFLFSWLRLSRGKILTFLEVGGVGGKSGGNLTGGSLFAPV